MKKYIKKLFSKKTIMFVVGVYGAVFLIEVIRKNTKLSSYEESARERFNLDGGFFQNIF